MSRTGDDVSDEVARRLARLLQPDSRIKFDREELGNLANLIMNASKDLEGLMTSMTRHSLDDNAHVVDAEAVRLREIFGEELTEMSQSDLSAARVKLLTHAIPEDLLVKASASGSLTRALGQMCLKAHRTVGANGQLSLYVRAMSDTSNSICFIVRGSYADGPRPAPDSTTVETSDGDEITLDAYASYMSETHIANLGGNYQETLDGDTSVNLVAIVPGDHVYNIGREIKPLPAQAVVG